MVSFQFTHDDVIEWVSYFTSYIELLLFIIYSSYDSFQTSLPVGSSPLVTRYTIHSHPHLPDPDTYSPPNCSSHLNSTVLLNSSIYLLSHAEWISHISSPPNTSCSYSGLSLLSSHCTTLTRDAHQFITPLQNSLYYHPDQFSPSYLYDCSQKTDGLPSYIYLDKSYAFNISLLFYLDASFPCLTQYGKNSFLSSFYH